MSKRIRIEEPEEIFPTRSVRRSLPPAIFVGDKRPFNQADDPNHSNHPNSSNSNSLGHFNAHRFLQSVQLDKNPNSIGSTQPYNDSGRSKHLDRSVAITHPNQSFQSSSHSSYHNPKSVNHSDRQCNPIVHQTIQQSNKKVPTLDRQREDIIERRKLEIERRKKEIEQRKKEIELNKRRMKEINQQRHEIERLRGEINKLKGQLKRSLEDCEQYKKLAVTKDTDSEKKVKIQYDQIKEFEASKEKEIMALRNAKDNEIHELRANLKELQTSCKENKEKFKALSVLSSSRKNLSNEVFQMLPHYAQQEWTKLRISYLFEIDESKRAISSQKKLVIELKNTISNQEKQIAEGNINQKNLNQRNEELRANIIQLQEQKVANEELNVQIIRLKEEKMSTERKIIVQKNKRNEEMQDKNSIEKKQQLVIKQISDFNKKMHEHAQKSQQEITELKLKIEEHENNRKKAQNQVRAMQCTVAAKERTLKAKERLSKQFVEARNKLVKDLRDAQEERDTLKKRIETEIKKNNDLRKINSELQELHNTNLDIQKVKTELYTLEKNQTTVHYPSPMNLPSQESHISSNIQAKKENLSHSSHSSYSSHPSSSAKNVGEENFPQSSSNLSVSTTENDRAIASHASYSSNPSNYLCSFERDGNNFPFSSQTDKNAIPDSSSKNKRTAYGGVVANNNPNSYLHMDKKNQADISSKLVSQTLIESNNPYPVPSPLKDENTNPYHKIFSSSSSNPTCIDTIPAKLESQYQNKNVSQCQNQDWNYPSSRAQQVPQQCSQTNTTPNPYSMHDYQNQILPQTSQGSHSSLQECNSPAQELPSRPLTTLNTLLQQSVPPPLYRDDNGISYY